LIHPCLRRRPAPWATCIFCRRPALWATDSISNRCISLLAKRQIQRFRYKGRARGALLQGIHRRRPALWATGSISNRCISLLAKRQIHRFRYKGRARGALLQGMHRRRRPAPWATGSFCRRPALWATDSISNRCISLLAKRQIHRLRTKVAHGVPS